MIVGPLLSLQMSFKPQICVPVVAKLSAAAVEKEIEIFRQRRRTSERRPAGSATAGQRRQSWRTSSAAAAVFWPPFAILLRLPHFY